MRRPRRIEKPTPEEKERFFGYVRGLHQPACCWIWEGARNDSGYGVFRLQGSNRYAHRVMYALEHGVCEAKHEVHHTCGNPLCVNPKHLARCSRTENIGERNHRRAKGYRPQDPTLDDVPF